MFTTSTRVSGTSALTFLIVLLVSAVIGACTHASSSSLDSTQIRAKLDAIPLEKEVHLSNEEWQVILSPEQFYVMRRSGTERPSKSGNAVEHRTGTYFCSACGNPLYDAEAKFNSGTGWPSFFRPIRKEAVQQGAGSPIFGTEISCTRCGSHLGHVFDDGPPPTGLRYCMNAVALAYPEKP